MPRAFKQEVGGWFQFYTSFDIALPDLEVPFLTNLGHST